jgi:formylglycine-generating enzyme required for sulfatase activity
MGSPASEKCRFSNEIQHPVTLTNKFEMMNTEVTQQQFKAFLGYSTSKCSYCPFPSKLQVCPAEQLSWHMAADFANALSKKAGKTACYTCTGSGTKVTCQEVAAYSGAKIYTCPGYRLPTEAEWEYAYRAGTKTAFYTGGITWCKNVKSPNLVAIGWFQCNSHVKYSGCVDGVGTMSCGSTCMGTNPVAQKNPNGWGLYDMAGNVWGWCHDGYGSYPKTSATNPIGAAGSKRVARGGSWFEHAMQDRAAERIYFTPGTGLYDLGFRLVRTLP